MIRRGWSHRDLCAMSEREFVGALEEQIAYDKAEAEARRQAMRAS